MNRRGVEKSGGAKEFVVVAEESAGVTAAPELENRILVWSLSKTDADTFEGCDWYRPDAFGSLHYAVRKFILDSLNCFYAEFSEWFNLAEYPDVLEQLQPPDVALFLKAAEAPDSTDFTTIENYDCFSGLCAVIRHRLEQRSLDQIKLAAELFNWTIDCGLFLADTKAQAVLRVGSVEEVAPFLLERILNRLPSNAKQRNPAYQVPPSDFEQRFLPLAPVLWMLKETVESADWVQNQLALRIFFWIADMYKAEVDNEGG
jgi:hypothetical protein